MTQTKLSCLLIVAFALTPITGLEAQTTVDVWLWGEWQQRVVSERYLVVTPSASPTATLEAAGFFGFEFLGTIDCDYQVGLFERQLASGTPVPYSTVDVIETLGVGMGQGYFWSPVFEDPAYPDHLGISPMPYTSIRFTPETTDPEARNIIGAAEIGTVVFNDAASNRYIVISAVASGLVVNERMAPLVDHPQVAEVGLSWMPAGACPSGGGGGGSPWPPTGGAPAEIPTLSTLALAALALLLVLGSLTTLRRRWSTTAPRAHQGQARLR